MTTKNLANPSLVTSDAIRSTFLIPIFGLFYLSLIYFFDLNQNLFLALNSISLHTGELIWAALTLFGDPVILLCLALSLYAIFPHVSFVILPTLIIGGSTVMFLKWFFAVVRPPGVLEDIIIIGTPPISGAFPSGHATGAFAFATLLILVTPNRYIKVLIFTLALLVGISRVAVGAHWPLDVSGGIILGWLSTIIGVHLSQNWQHTANTTRIICILLLVSSGYLFFRNTGFAQVQLLQFAIAIGGTAIATMALLKGYKRK